MKSLMVVRLIVAQDARIHMDIFLVPASVNLDVHVSVVTQGIKIIIVWNFPTAQDIKVMKRLKFLPSSSSFFFQDCSIANEVYRSCQIYCGETCQHPQVVNDECLKRTCQRGCFCKFNFLRDELTGECVPEKDCDGA